MPETSIPESIRTSSANPLRAVTTRVQANLPAAPSLETLREEVSPQQILEALRELALEPAAQQMLRVLDLELSQNQLEEVGAKSVAEPSELERLLLYQTALVNRSGERFFEWVQAEESVCTDDNCTRLHAEALFCRALFFSGVAPLKMEPPSAAGSAAAKRLMQLALCCEGRWQDLVTQQQGEVTAEQLLAAHVAQDRLSDHRLRMKVIKRLGSVQPVCAAEWELESAWGSGKAELVREALRRRAETLKDAKLLPQLAANTMLLTAQGAISDPQFQQLTPPQAGNAWRHLQFLIRGEQLGRDIDKRVQLLKDEVIQLHRLPPQMAVAYAIRCSELSMARDRWSEALETLPKGPLDNVLLELTELYRHICLIQMNKWDQLAGLMAQIGQKVEESNERALWFNGALLCAMNSDLKKHPVVMQMEKQLDALAEPQQVTVARTLLVAYTLQGNQDGSARLWQRMAQHAEANMRPVFAFTAGAVQLRKESAQAALQQLQQLAVDEKTAPIIKSAQAIAGVLVEDWPTVVDALEEAATALPPQQRDRLLSLAVKVAWASGDLQRTRELLTLPAAAGDSNELDLLRAAVLLHEGDRRGAADTLRAVSTSTGNGSGNLFRCLAADILAGDGDTSAEAEQLYRDVLSDEPTNLSALTGLNRLFTASHRIEELPDLLAQRLELAQNEAERLPIHLQLAQSLKDLWFEKRDDALFKKCMTHCEAALKIDAAAAETIQIVVELCREQNDWSFILKRSQSLQESEVGLFAMQQASAAKKDWKKFAQVSARLSEVASDISMRSAAALAAGNTFAEHLDDEASAEKYLRMALEQSFSTEALDSLAQLMRKQKRIRDLVEILEQRSSQNDDTELRVRLSLELGKLYATQLDQPDEARTHYQQVTRLDTRNREALRALVELSADDAAYRQRLLEQLLQLAKDPEAELSCLNQLVEVYRESDNNEGLLNVGRRLRALLVHQADVFETVENIFGRLGQHGELVELYDARLAIDKPALEAEKAAELLKRKAHIQLNVLDAPADAADSYLLALNYRAGDEQLLGTLEKLLRDLGDWPKLVAIYESHAKQLTDEKEKIAFLQRAAKIAHYQLKDEAEAVRLYEQIYAIDPSDPVAFSALERRLERQADHARLADLLLDRAGRTDAPGEKIEFLLQAAGVCESRQDVDRAIQLYWSALDVSAKCAQALDALSRIYESLEHWRDFLDVTKRQLKLQKDPNRKALLYFKCGSVVETQFHDDEAAYEYYSLAVKSSPACLPALHGLRDLQAKRGEWSLVAKTLAAEVRVWSDPKGKADVLAQLGEIYETHLGERAKALECYQRAIKTHPECMRAALALFKIYSNEGSFKEAAQWGRIYARRGHLRGDANERLQFFARWGEVLKILRRYKESVVSLTRALDIDPCHPAALFTMVELCRTQPDVHDFHDTFGGLLKEANRRNNKTARAILSVGTGLLAEKRGDVDSAVHLYEQAIELEGVQFRLVRPYADLLALLGSSDRAVELIASSRKQSEVLQFDLWVDATNWLGDFSLHNEQYERAVGYYREILDRQPNLHFIRRQLARALMLAGQATEAATELQQVCDHLAAKSQNMKRLAESYHALGLASAQSGNTQAAELNWRRAYELTPENIYPYIALAKQFHAAGKQSEAERELRLAEQGTSERHPDLMRAHAEFFAAQGYPDRAVTLYRKSLQVPDTQIDDRLNLARHLAARGEQAGAIALINDVLDEDPVCLGAYQALSDVFEQAGDTARAQRVEHVLKLELVHSEGEVAVRPLKQLLNADGLAKFASTISSTALGEVWMVLRDDIKKIFAANESEMTLPPPTAVKSAVDGLRAPFGFESELVFSDADQPIVSVLTDKIVLSSKLRGVSAPEIKSLTAIALAAKKLTFGPLFNLSTDDQLNATRILALALLPRERWSPELVQLVDELPRREQRQLTRIATEYRERGSRGKTLAEEAIAWLEEVERTVVRLALLVTGDLVSLGKALALQQHISPDCYEEGGLLIFPNVQQLCRYFVSEAYDQQRATLGIEAQ